MFLFAFNLYKQINLFTKHIFANKDITIPYYIYSCFVRSSPLPRPDVMPAVCPSCRSSNTDSRGSCLPDQSARLLPSPGILLAVLHPLGGILHPATGKGHARHSSARRAVSRLNRSFKVRLIDAITLIINYLCAPLGCAFIEIFVG